MVNNAAAMIAMMWWQVNWGLKLLLTLMLPLLAFLILRKDHGKNG